MTTSFGSCPFQSFGVTGVNRHCAKYPANTPTRNTSFCKSPLCQPSAPPCHAGYSDTISKSHNSISTRSSLDRDRANHRARSVSSNFRGAFNNPTLVGNSGSTDASRLEFHHAHPIELSPGSIASNGRRVTWLDTATPARRLDTRTRFHTAPPDRITACRLIFEPDAAPETPTDQA